MNKDEQLFDLERLTDEWFAVEDATRRGDRDALAAWVLENGAATRQERELLADVIRGRIDARKVPKPGSAEMLEELDRYLCHRATLETVRQWTQRFRQRLLRRKGWDAKRVQELLRRKNLDPFPTLTMEGVFEKVAAIHGVEPESVKKAHQRRARKKQQDRLAAAQRGKVKPK